ncbi:PIN-like domain-containing protein [Arthrobacter sp. MMS24-S77]
MKFLLDECVSYRLMPSLEAAFRNCEFHSVKSLNWRGTLDPKLFRAAAEESFDVLVSLDHKILRLDDERYALRKAGLHFAAIERPPLGVKGRDFNSLVLAQLVSCLTLVLRTSPAAPTLFRLGGVPHDHTKRLTLERI